MVSLDPTSVSMVNRAANLFFFYQTDDPFQQLQMHDYGFFAYEKSESYMTYKPSSTSEEGEDGEIRRSDLFSTA